jgi:orotate phosphoribosyltransferase
LKTVDESGLEFDSVAGVSTGAITWGMLVADRLNKPFSYIRTKPKGHGAGKQVEGVVQKGEKVLVIEDLFSTAGSSVAAVKGMRKETGAEIVGVIAISTYEFEKARKALEEADVPWWTLTNFSTLVQELDVSDDQKTMITKFAENPAAWWDDFS